MATSKKTTTKTTTNNKGTTKGATTAGSGKNTTSKTDTKKTSAGKIDGKVTEQKKNKQFVPAYLDMGKKGQGTEIGDPALIKDTYQYDPTLAAQQDLSTYGEQRANIDRQNRLASGLEEAVAGRGPSIAQLQFEKNRDEAMAANSAMAASAQGGNRAMASRAAMYANAQAGQQSARDAAILRAQEQIAARGELATAIQQGRAADLDFAKAQGTLNQEVALANATAGNTAAQANLTARYTLAKQNQDTINAARQKQADLAAGIRQAGIGAGATRGAAASMAGASMYGADAGLAAALAGLGQKEKDSLRDQATTKREQNIKVLLGGTNAAASAAGMKTGG